MSSTFLSVVLHLVALPFLIGCTTRFSQHDERVARQRAILSALTKQTTLSAPELILQYHASETREEEKRRLRNQFIDLSMIEIDQRHSIFADDFTTSKKTFDTITEFGAVVAAATSAAFNPASTKSVLSLVSGAFTASNTSVTKNMFYEQTMKALVQQMSAQRRAVASDIIQGIGKRTDVYPLSAALHDIERYYMAGTIEGAFAAIQDSAAKKEAMAEQKIEAVRKEMEGVTLYRERAARWIRQNGTDAARTKLKSWYSTQTALVQIESRLALASAAMNSALPPSAISRAVPEPARSDAEQLIIADRAANPRTATFVARHAGNTDINLLTDALPDAALADSLGALSKYDILELDSSNK